MAAKPLPTFSLSDKTLAIADAVAGAVCTVVIVHGITSRRWQRVHTVFAILGSSIEAFKILRGIARRALAMRSEPHIGEIAQ